MNSILRKVDPQGIAAATGSCREKVSLIYLIVQLQLVIGILLWLFSHQWDSCMALLAGALILLC